MRRGRRSSPAWRIAKKVIVLIAVLVCVRILWVSVIKGWGHGTALVDVEINDYHLKELSKLKPQTIHSDGIISDNELHGKHKVFTKTRNVYIEKPENSDNNKNELKFDSSSIIRSAAIKPTTSRKTTTGKVIDAKTQENNKLNENKNNSVKETKPDTKANKTKPDKDEVLQGRYYDTNKNTSKKKLDTPNDKTRTQLKSTGNKNTTVVTKSIKNVTTKESIDQSKKPHTEVVSDGVCQLTSPWGQKYQAQMSTYDLAKQANYSVDEAGAYFIPTRKAADIIKYRNLSHVTVILVPFSHADPGYGMTMETYYTQRTRSTLTHMLSKLAKYPKMTFQWAETVFLSRWFEDLQDKEKEMVRRLVRRGQLEIVLGGWVMPDEASTHYVSVVDQLIEGHQWLIENIGVKPRNAWVNDPFGYSSTMPYLWKASGMDNMVFLRIDQALKSELMKLKSLEFNWRPYWKRDNSSDMLATLMSYTNYWIADVCGPNPAICNEFGFINQGYNDQVINITDKNVERQSMKLYEQLRITADLYKYNTLYIGLGEDFSFGREEDWDNLYRNYDQIMKFFDSKHDLKMKIKFGTLADYFANVRQQAKRQAEDSNNMEFPTLSGDFFPYTERKHEYWTGYYTTRPLNKRFSRDIGSLLRAADIFNVFAYSTFKHYGVKYTGYTDVAKNLRTARRELGMFLHHDGITGTSVPNVIDDFERRLMMAYTAVNEAFRTILTSLLTKGRNQTPKLMMDAYSRQDSKSIIRNNVLDINKNSRIVLVNSLPRKRKEAISVYVNSKNFELNGPSQSFVPVQITSYPGISAYIRVTFPIELPAFGVAVYNFKQRPGTNQDNIVQNEQLAVTKESKAIVIKNDFLTIEFDASTGMMKQVTDRSGRVTKLSAKFYAYKAVASGAYIFGPAGPADALVTGNTTIKVSQGNLVSEVQVISPGIYHSVKLYNTPGLQGHGIHITNEIDMATVALNEMEVILRFETDLKNGNNFYTDQNGFQMMGRETKPKMKIEANYYPISNMLVLEDNVKRLTVHSRQAHGVASLGEGQLEVMLDRHSMRDDGRGLGQGYFQNVNVNSDFVLQLEYKTFERSVQEVRYTYPTQDSTILNDLLQNEIFVYSLTDSSLFSMNKFNPLKTSQFPCDVSIVGLRNLVKNDLSYNGTSLVLHRKTFECGYQSVSKHCGGQHKLTLRNLISKLEVGIVETSLSHLDNKTVLDMDTDITPEHMELRAFRIQV